MESRVTTDTCTLAPGPELDIGMVDGPPEFQFFQVRAAAVLSDGRIAVVDRGSSQVRLFEPDGTFDLAFGGAGGGPGEFRDVFRIWVTPGDTLIVGDARPLRFLFFTPNGAHLKTVVPRPLYPNHPHSVAPMPDGSFVVAQECCWGLTGEWEWVERELHLVRHDAEGRLTDTLAVLPNGRWAVLDEELAIAAPPVFEAMSWVAAAGDRFVVGRGSEREIEIHEPPALSTTRAGGARNRPALVVRWSGDSRAVTQSDIDAYRRAERRRHTETKSADPEWYRRAGEALASDERLVAERFPAHADIRAATSGDVWVREYPRPGGNEQEWLVFDRSGRFECRVVLPFAEPWNLFEIGADYVLGKELDELEVEHVRRYAVSRPGR